MASRAPRISVVIPTYNRRALLTRTLPSVLAQDIRGEDYEIIIVVDGSTDGSAAWLGGLTPPVAFQVIEQPNKGPGAARNAGVAAARGRVVLFLDDDILCGPSLLREHLAAHDAAEPCVVFGPVLVAPESPPSLATELTRRDTAGWTARVERQAAPSWPYDALVDANTSLPRASLIECGGFDERFGRQRETADLGLRLWAGGHRFHYQPGASVHHIYVKSSCNLVRTDAVEYGQASVLLCRKHPAYRPHSALAGWGTGPWWRRTLRSAALRAPLLADLLLQPPLRVAESLRSLPLSRRAGLRLLGWALGVAMLRGATQAAGSWRRLRADFGARLPVLLYHHIGPPRPGTYSELTISPSRFERQIRWLARRGYRGIRPIDWQQWRLGAARLPDKPVMITFDDAYADIAEFALPVLEHHGFGAAVFVVTQALGGTNRWDEEEGCGTHRLMSAEEIRTWSGRGFEFGSHSRSHPDLRRLADADRALEISGGVSDLGDLLGHAPSAFAYPYGAYDEGVMERTRRAFDLAFTCEEGLNDLRTDPHALRRTMVQRNDLWADFVLRVRLGSSPLMRLRSRIRLRTRLAAAGERLGLGAR